MHILTWLLKMAWRDSRRNRSRLFLFISSVILGVAALVAIYSLGDNMKQEVERQASSLLGADLKISINRAVSNDLKLMTDTLGDQRSEERSFTSMIYFLKDSGTRLVQVRAIGGAYPYYGDLETEPQGQGRIFRNSQSVLVDETLMLQYNARPGDSVRIGDLSFVIAGSLTGSPGQTGFSASVAPKVYMPLQFLERSGLSQKGSRINTTWYFKFNDQAKAQEIIKKLEPKLDKENINYDTIESQKEDTSRSLGDLASFLSLVSFIALLLGCIGVASSMNIYVKEKISTIAILRCLGAKGRQAFMIYLLQILIIGLIGSVAGALLGTVIQQLLPILLKDVIPIEINTPISWISVAQGITAGVVISLLFAFLPLVSIRRISPLNTLRLAVQPVSKADPLKWLIYLLIVLLIFGFSYLQMETMQQAILFTLGVIIAFFILSGIAWLLMWVLRRFFPTRWNYLWRQGIANLFRPNNQTSTLVVAIGLGTAFICTLISVQSILLNRVDLSAAASQSNTVLFDIQSEQKDSVLALASRHQLPVQGVVPIVNMRLESVNSINAAVLEKDSTLPMRRWLFSREYRVTYRDSLTSSEKITKGKWIGKVSGTGEVFVSLEERFAQRNGIKIGDTMYFNVQGTLMQVRVGSFREVDFNRIQTNFLVVFPEGVIEDAPKFFVLLTRIEDKIASARFQQQVVQHFPNVSIIDLSLVLSVLNDLLRRISFIIRFIAGFSIATGLIVLIASVLTSKYQRIRESVLLRTIGASRKQIFYITALEYLFLGALAAMTGIILSLGFSWGLAEFIFEAPFTPELLPLLIVFISICLLTVLIGLVNIREVVKRSPLEVLREES